jgi:hypothetical protein
MHIPPHTIKIKSFYETRTKPLTKQMVQLQCAIQITTQLTPILLT